MIALGGWLAALFTGTEASFSFHDLESLYPRELPSGRRASRVEKSQVAMAEPLTGCAVGHCASLSFLETTFKMVKRRAKVCGTSLFNPST